MLFGLIKTKEEKFWNWFAKVNQEYYIDGQENELISRELFTRLRKIRIGINFLVYVNADRKNKELIISSNGKKRLFPLINKIIEKAPSIDNWKFKALIGRMTEDDMKTTFNDTIYTYSDIFFRYEPASENRINIELNIRNYQPSRMSRHMAFLLLCSLIGEIDVANKIWLIDCKVLDESKMEILKPFKQLVDIVDNLQTS